MKRKVALIILLLCEASCVGKLTRVLSVRREGAGQWRWPCNVVLSSPLFPPRSLVLRGGGEEGTDVEAEAERGKFAALQLELQERMLEGVQRGDDELKLREELERQLIKHLDFENASIPDNFPAALRRLAEGCPVASSNWTCCACSASSEAHMLACIECGMRRSLVEHALPVKHINVLVPQDMQTLADALNHAQHDMSTEWNAAGRSAIIRVASGSHTWDKELLVLCNMSLSLVGRGFQGKEGGCLTSHTTFE
jgi:hypothetical protein